MTSDSPDMVRRALITGAWRKPEAAPAVIRPPGAVAEETFAALCDGCGECAHVCPADAITMTGPATQMATSTPHILVTESPCVMCDDLLCSAACPVDALVSVTPETMHIGRIEFHAGACLAAQGIDPGCDYCFDRCPLKGTAITYTRGRGPEIHAEHCTGCGTCVFFCPAQPKALELTPEELGKS